MSCNFLSPVHIDKLGHPIEEIRARALHSVWSKYDLDLVDDSNFENTNLLLVKLIDWFNFETHPHEEKVLKLILRILKPINSDLVTEKINVKQVLVKIDRIKINIDERYLPLIEEIRECLRKIEDNLLHPSLDSCQQFAVCNNKLEDAVIARQKIHQNSCYTRVKCHLHSQSKYDIDSGDNIQRMEHSNFSYSELIGPTEKCKNEKPQYCRENKSKTMINTNATGVEYFPWQLLDINDSSALSSVYDGLRYLDNIDSILHSCQFYTDILLHDFPTEIFLQRPLLIQTFFELLQSKESAIYVPATNCLLATVKHLNNRLQIFLDASLIYSNECYRGAAFSKLHKDDERSFERDEHKRFMTKIYSSDSDTDVEKEEELLCIKSQQYSFTELCFSILSKAIPQLSEEKSLEEHNVNFELIMETFSSLAMNILPEMACHTEIKDKIYKIFNLFHSPIKYHKTSNSIIHSIIMYIIVKMLNLFKCPDEKFQEILPHSIQLELAECVSDYIFVLMHPNLNSKIKIFIEKCLGQRKKEILDMHEATLELCLSMKSAVEFLKRRNRLKSKMDLLNCIQKALPCLEFHRNFEFLREFIKCCLFKWSEKQLKVNEFNLRKIILLKLLSNNDVGVKVTMYKELHTYVIKNLGIDEHAKPKFQYPGDKFGFLLDSEVFTEIICHGINSDQIEIKNISSEIFVHLLKGRIFFSDSSWQNLMKALSPCLCLLQCFADKSTALGRCVFKMLDPDISKTISLSSLDLLRGNLRLLFSKNSLIREEALLRLFWLLTREDPEKVKLPRLSLLRGINLSAICSSVEPEELSNMNQSFFSGDSVSNVMEMLSTEGLEPSVRRSALTQLSVMLEDSNLHSTFLEQNGLNIILDIFKNCLIEKEYQHYPDSAVPIMKILKHISVDNPPVRIQLSQNIDLYYCVLRGLLLFNSERHSRQQGVELLCLLLYNEYVINVKSERTIVCKISIPQILVNRICLPFLTHIHWKYSQHSEPSKRESVMLREKSASLLRTSWNIEWFGGISQVLSLKTDDLRENIFSPSLPNDMKLKTEDLSTLRSCSITFGVRQTLFDIQNATSHEAVISSLHNLKSYLILYDLERSLGNGDGLNNLDETTASLMNMKWANTFERFLLSTPSCEDDEVLLYQIICSVRLILRTFQSEELYMWSEKLLTNEVEILASVLKSHTESNTNLTRRDVTRALTGLIKDTVTRTMECLPSNWVLYINLITHQLKLNKKHGFRDVAHVDCLLSVLVDVTGRSTQRNFRKSDFYKETITRTMETIVAFHCTKYSQSSFFGTSIIKNCLIVLNNILNDTQATIEGWECLWNHALSEVTCHIEQPNYCWLLSLWLYRDPIIKALAVQLLSGFSLTCQSCELLLEKFQIDFEYLWSEGFKLLLDDSECNIVREKAALLLSNLTCHGSVTTAKEYLQNLTEINLYENLCGIYERIQVDEVENGTIYPYALQLFSRQFEDPFEAIVRSSTPSLVSAICTLLINIIFLSPEEIGEIIIRAGLLDNLKKIFIEAPEVCFKYKEKEHSIELIKMYKNCCKVITKCMTTKFEAYSSVRQNQQFINSIFNLMNHGLYDENSKIVLDERNKLWCEILDALSVIISQPIAKNYDIDSLTIDGFKALNCALTENGTDCFISTLYVAISSNFCELRLRCLRFLANFFGLESHKSSQVTIADIFDRPLMSKAVEHAEKFRWKGLSIYEKLDLHCGRRISNILLQMYRIIDHKSELKTLVTDALGSLLSICENAQNYCLDEGLAEDLAESLRSVFIKLNMENVDCVKKSADKKRVDTILLQMENSYRLLTNFITGNEKIKSYVANIGLASLLHKLWCWCTWKNSLLITAFKLLCTFTLNSESACRSLALDKSWSVIGLRKPQGALTLIQTVMQSMENEIDLISKTSTGERSLQLSFQLLENCCRSAECRCIFAKGTMIRCFGNYYHGFLNKRRSQSDFIMDLWCNVFMIFTSYQEGQLALPRNQDALEAIVETASMSNCGQRKKALKILRNISFHQLNRVQLLAHYKFLSVVVEAVKSGDDEEIDLGLHAIWGLICNSQKGKIIIRNAGLEDVLKEVMKKLKLCGGSKNLEVADSVLQILMNK